MSVASPPWLLAAVAAAIALLVFWRASDRKRRAALALFAAPQLLGDLTASVSARRRALKRALIVAGVLLGGLALAGPQYGFTWEETQRRGIDVLIALDTSRSMLAQDVAPNRLERAKLAVRDLVDQLGSDRVGLIAFAGSAFLQVPLTLDHAAFLESLDALQPGVIPTPGSDLASALRTAEQALATEQRNVKLLVLFSDGEDLGGAAIEAAKHAAEQGIRVFTVGVGSDTGELIPVPSAGGGTEFLKDPQGQYVKSKLDAETLRQVAELTGGFYEPLGRRGEGVAAIYDRALAPLPKEELASRMRRVPIERFQWPLAIALLCLALEPILRERVTRGRGAKASGAAVVLLATLLASASAEAASVREAQRLYAAGKYEEAFAEYRAAVGDKPAPPLDFNLGASAYKAGQYGDAAGAFARALGSDDPKLQEQSFYNLGNAQFRLGEQTKESKPQQTMQAWQQAIEAYESALKVDPKDDDARYNRDFVKHALEELQKQQQQKQDQKDQQKKDEQKDDQQQQQQQQDQQEQQNGGDEKQQQDQKPDQNDQQKPDQKQDEQKGDGEPQPTPDQHQKQPPKNDGGDEKKKDEQQPSQGDQGKPNDQQQPGDSQQAGPPQQQPGQMSPDDARDLLDSLKNGEDNLQQLDQNAQQQRRGRPREQERDW